MAKENDLSFEDLGLLFTWHFHLAVTNEAGTNAERENFWEMVTTLRSGRPEIAGPVVVSQMTTRLS